MELKLEVTSVSLNYDRFSLSNINFSLKTHDMLGLFGRSGSGKSTIIKALLGQKELAHGSMSLYIDGRRVQVNDYLGYSPQQNSLFPLLSVEENLETFGQLSKMKDKEIRIRIDLLLRRLNLIHHRNKKIINLSGGMQKRVDLAVSLIHSPRLIILDEPFNGLDISLQSFIWELLTELSKEDKIIIIASHMLSDIQAHCNQLGLVENGTYYNSEQIARSVSASGEKSLEAFSERLFSYAYGKGN
ncbi:MAG: ABC transporter ATP-binding protein [Nanoarchaeota archaeon]|nr:ABC transporter ATP-binding protein [Nanoarchaeota archaeon]